MTKKILSTIAAVVLATLGASAQASDTASKHAHEMSEPTAKMAAPSCPFGKGQCVPFPSRFGLSRGELLSILEIEVICEGETDAVGDRLGALQQAGPPGAAVEAIVHVIQTQPDLSLHAVKVAFEVLGELDAPEASAALKGMYDDADALAARAYGKLEVADAARGKMAADQAEDLRRQVVLALGKRPEERLFLEETARGGDPSVAAAAMRSLDVLEQGQSR